MGNYYLAIDGDDVGNELERHILRNDAEALMAFSDHYRQASKWLLDRFEQLPDSKIILTGGDTLLLSLPNATPIELLEKIRQDFNKIAQGNTLSMGVGNTIREAHIALKFAKASGKNQLCNFKDLP